MFEQKLDAIMVNLLVDGAVLIEPRKNLGELPMRSIKPANSIFTIDELRGYVGEPGYNTIEMLSTPWDDFIMAVNEEGKIINLPENLWATFIMLPLLIPGDSICGNAVILRRDLWN